jgi:uncharacterized membrane protein YkoI
MMKFNLLAGVALMSGLLAAPVFAASSTDMQGVQAAKVSLSGAITAAQKMGNGKAVRAEYRTEDGAGKYEVVVVSGGKTNTMDVDPTTGQAVRAKRDDTGKSDKEGAEAIESAQTGLGDAIMAAEKEGGKALEAKLDEKEGMAAYKVEVANGDKTATVWVDAGSGQIIKKS